MKDLRHSAKPFYRNELILDETKISNEEDEKDSCACTMCIR